MSELFAFVVSFGEPRFQEFYDFLMKAVPPMIKKKVWWKSVRRRGWQIRLRWVDCAARLRLLTSATGGRMNSQRYRAPERLSPAVNLDWKVVTFPRSRAGIGYQIPTNEIALNALKTLHKRSPDGTGPVIRKPSGLELKSAWKWFEESCKKAGIVDLRLHDLRHTFATRLRRHKVPLEDIAALLGHDLKKNSMTARYAHVDLDVLREAVATLVKNQSDTKTDTPPVLAFPVANAG